MKLRIGVSARFHGTTEVEIPDEDIERYGGINAYVDRDPEDWAARVLEDAPELDADVDDLDLWNEETERWEMVPEDD